MEKKSKMLSCSITAFVISAMSVIVIMGAGYIADNQENTANIMGTIAGILFWAGLIAGGILYALALKKIPKQIRVIQGIRPGILHFFSNMQATVADIIMIISIVLTIYFAMNDKSNQAIAAVVLFIMLLSIYAHCLLNGKVFRYILSQSI